MANKAISELPQALNVNNQDLFVLEQSGIAKKLTAETFITEQGIIDALAEALDGHGGIQSVTLSSVSGRIRTYLITFTDGTSTTFQVLDGTSIDRIVKTSTAGLTDTYTVFMTDGTTTFFTVTNGADGTVSEAMLNDALKNKAPAITETTESSAIANFTDGADDMVMYNVVAEINPVQDLTYGSPYPAGGGKNLCSVNTISGVGWASDNADLLAVINSLPEGTYNMSFLSTLTSLDSDSYVSATWITGFNFTNPNGNFNNQATTNSSHPVNSTQTANKALTITSSTAGAFTHAYVYGAGNNSNGKIGTATISKIQIESGSTATTYAPYSNICPITGRTGCNVTRAGKNIADKNIFDINKPSWSTAQYWLGLSENADGTYTLTRPIGWGGHGYVYIGTYPAGTYTVSFDLKSTASVTCGAILRAYNTKTWVTNAQTDKSGMSTTGRKSMSTITTTAVCDFWLAVGPYTSNGSEVISGDYQVEVGKTATAYEPYQDSSVTVDWSTEAGTVYGGTIDVVSGKLVVDRAYGTLDGSESWIGSSAEWYTNKHDMLRMVDYTNMIKCDTLQTVARASVSQADFHITGYGASSSYIGQNWIYVKLDPSITTASQVQAWLREHPTHYVYPLAEPQTYQLTGQQLMTLLGSNNVWADTGNVSVTYPADTKMFIEKLTMPTEDDLVANQAITSGKFFMVGNNLYIATAAIASGAKIIEGTNATRLSLADALNRL